MKNKNIVLLIVIGILLIVSLSVGMSYALWSQNHTQTTSNELLSGCFSTTLTEGSNIYLTNQYPISDATGLTGTPYTFTISNTCTIAANYEINLETLSTTTADSKFIKLSLDGATSNLLNSYSTVDTTITGAINSYQLKTGYISAGSSITYNLRLWVTESATIADMANKTFDSKIVVNTAASHDSLEDTLINTAGGKTAIAAKTTPDFSKTEPLITSYDSQSQQQINVTASQMESSSPYVTYGSTYTYNIDTSTFVISNPQSCKISECYSLLSNKYVNFTETSDLNASSPSLLYKINTITYDNDKKEYYLDLSLINQITTTQATELNVLYGDSYTFDSTTGKYSIVNGTVGKFSDVYTQLTNKYCFRSSLEINTSYSEKNLIKIASVTYDSTNSQYFYDESESFDVNEIYDSTASGMYSAPDDYGTSYYYRGDISNNNIIFGGFCWKAVRVNGNGTTRMIYNGTPSNGTCSAEGNDTMAAFSSYNDNNNDNAYVGFMFGNNLTTSYINTHSNIISSTIKDSLDNWYQNNLLIYDSKISDSVFCNDRSLLTGTGLSSAFTLYEANNRIGNNYTPTYICSQKNDKFTKNDNQIGNTNLKYPIGLITMDEVEYAGSNMGMNKDYYLYTTNWYYTMTPNYFSDNPSIFIVGDSVYSTSSNSVGGVRPVINLKYDNFVSAGIGTTSNPYQIS
jgi:hypothetical protein